MSTPCASHQKGRTVKALKEVKAQSVGIGQPGSRWDKEVGAHWEECWVGDQGRYPTHPYSFHPSLEKLRSQGG